MPHNNSAHMRTKGQFTPDQRATMMRQIAVEFNSRGGVVRLNPKSRRWERLLTHQVARHVLSLWGKRNEAHRELVGVVLADLVRQQQKITFLADVGAKMNPEFMAEQVRRAEAMRERDWRAQQQHRGLPRKEQRVMAAAAG